MATVTSFTAERSLEIENGTVVHGEVNDEGRLILFRRDGQAIDAGIVSGASGDPGSGVSDIKVTYQASRSGIEEPQGIWEESVPIVPAGWYLWVRTVVSYMNPNDPTESFQTTSFTVTRQGADGVAGKDGSDGRGIRDTTIQYQEGISSQTPPDSNWLPNPPANLTSGRFLWTRTTIRYTDGSPSDISYSVAKQGSNGDKGSAGDPGKDGRTQYLHVAYANSADGTESFSVSDPTGRSYMGTYGSFEILDSNDPSDYTWSLIKGASGTGINSTTVHYSRSTSGTTPPSGGWATTIPTVPEGEFLWTRTVVNFTDGASQTSYSIAKQGAKGDKGEDGNDGLPGKDGLGLVSTQVNYAQSTSGTVTPTEGWTSSVPTLIKGRFLWTRTIWIYNDESSERGYSVSYVPEDGSNGTDGLPGKDGVGITNTAITYAKSASGTTPPSSGWSNQPPSTVAGDYIWTRTIWTYSDRSTETGYSVGRIGENGSKGVDGKDGNDGIPGAPGTSVTAIDTFYFLSATQPAKPADTVVTPPSPWTLTQPTYSPGSTNNLYVVTRVTFSNNTRKYSAVSLDSSYAAAKSAHLKYEFATRAPTNADGSGRPEGAMWVQKDSNGAVTGYWEWTGASWVKRPLSDDIIPLIRANMLSVDALDGKLIQGATIRGGIVEQFKDSRSRGTYTHRLDEVPTSQPANSNQTYETSVGTTTSSYMIVAKPSPDGSGPGCRAVWYIPSDYIGATIRVSFLVRRPSAGPVRVGEVSTSNNPTNVSANVWTRVNSPNFEFSGGLIVAQMDGGPELWATTPIVTVVTEGRASATLAPTDSSVALTFRHNDKVSGDYSPTGARISKERDDGSNARTMIWPAQIELEEVMPDGSTNNAWITGIFARKNPLWIHSVSNLVFDSPTITLRASEQINADGLLITNSGIDIGSSGRTNGNIIGIRNNGFIFNGGKFNATHIPASMETLTVSKRNVAAGGVTNVTLTFASGRYNRTPQAIAAVWGDARDTTVQVDSISTTSCVVRLGSMSTVTRNIGAQVMIVQNTF